MEKHLKRNIDDMLDTIYSPIGVHLKTVASVNAAFNHIIKVGGEIGRDKQHRKSTPTWKGSTQNTMYLD